MTEGDISISQSSSSKDDQHSSDSDKPNITVDGQKEVHLRYSDQNASDEGSIVAAPNVSYPIDTTKDPVISKVPEDRTVQNAQSKCCLLI